MKKLKIHLLLVLMLGGAFASQAQDQITDFLDAGKSDASILADAYLRPYGDMLGKTLNGGWYNTAKVHGVLGFDITFGVNMAMAPSSMETFDLNSLLPRMSGTWNLKDPSLHIAPTVAGEMGDAQRPVLQQQGIDVFQMPDGSGFGKLPMPVAQVSLGLPFHTDVSVRFVPKMKVGNAGKIGLYGFALKHSLKEYLPFISHLPALQTSLMMGYTNLSSDIGVDYIGGSGQMLEVNSSGFTTRLLVGVNIPVIAVYTGLGYGNTSSDFDLKGNYGPGLGDDPISLAYKNTGFDFNAGLRLKLGFFAIHGDYTFGEYSMLSAGVGINFR